MGIEDLPRPSDYAPPKPAAVHPDLGGEGEPIRGLLVCVPGEEPKVWPFAVMSDGVTVKEIAHPDTASVVTLPPAKGSYRIRPELQPMLDRLEEIRRMETVDKPLALYVEETGCERQVELLQALAAIWGGDNEAKRKWLEQRCDPLGDKPAKLLSGGAVGRVIDFLRKAA